MRDKTQIIAVQIINDRLIALKTYYHPSLSYEELIYKIATGEEFFFRIEDKEMTFRVSDDGSKIIEPPMEDIKKLPSF